MKHFRIRLAITSVSSFSSRNFSLALFIVVMIFAYGKDARPIKSVRQQKNNEKRENGNGIPTEFDKLKVPAEDFDKIRHLHDTLYYGAVKALVGQMGRKHYKQLTKAEKRKLAQCLDRIGAQQKEVVKAAKCLVESRKRQQKANGTMEMDRQMGKKYDKVPLMVTKEEGGKMADEEHKKVPFVQEEESHEQRRPTTERKETTSSKRLLRYMGKVRKRKSRSLLREGRTNEHNWMNGLDETSKETTTVSDRNERFLEEKRPIEREEKLKITSLISLAPLASRADKSVGSRITNLLVKLLSGRRNNRTNERWDKNNVYGRLKRLAKEIERTKKFPGSKVFEKRMFDIVLERDEASLGPEDKHSHTGLLQDGLKLINLALSSNRSGSSSNKNLRLFSPRFMPLTPDKGGFLNNNSLLSPTLLSMYEEHDNKSVGNVPEMLRMAGVGEKERLGLIGTLMDITGTTDKVEQTLDMFKQMDFFNQGVGGPLMGTADRIVKAFFALEDSMDTEQKRQCEQNGYTFARKEQIEKLLRDQAVDLSKLPELEEFEVYDQMSVHDKELALWATIEQIAAGNASAQLQKHTERPFSPTALQAHFCHARARGRHSVALRIRSKPRLGRVGPHHFVTEQLQPGHFGPDNPFSARSLSEHFQATSSQPVTKVQYIQSYLLGLIDIRAFPFIILFIRRSNNLWTFFMSPSILSPSVAHPYILSPVLLGSLILNPTILTPFILSPVAIAPSILNPFALSPVIFSPLVLSPDIISPQTLGGAIFSPVMLSPAILTQAYIMVSIFSPSFLS